MTFDRFYRGEWDVAVRLGTMLIGSPHEAEEIAQEAFSTIHLRWGEIDNPSAYLKVCIANAAKNVIRKRALRRNRGWLRETELVAHLGQSELWDALGALPTRQRTAVVLKFYGDLSLKDIADAIGCREGTAASLVHRGIETLRKALPK